MESGQGIGFTGQGVRPENEYFVKVRYPGVVKYNLSHLEVWGRKGAHLIHHRKKIHWSSDTWEDSDLGVRRDPPPGEAL